MFERFTERSRKVVVLSQECSRELGHNYIGTEHLLLGLLQEPHGIAGSVLRQLDIDAQTVREHVLATIGRGDGTSSTQIPFTPRAKKVLELSRREALKFGNNNIDTEHILLGLLREGEGVAAQFIAARVGKIDDVRVAIGLALEPEQAAVAGAGAARTSVRTTVTAESLAEEGLYDPKCPTCRASLPETAAFKTLDVPEDGGPSHLKMVTVYCESCGVSLATKIID